MSGQATLPSLDPRKPRGRAGRAQPKGGLAALQPDVAQRDVGEDSLRQLLAVSDELSGAITPSDVVDVVTRSVVEALHARAAEISLLEDDDLVLIGAVGYDPIVAAALARMPIDSSWPLAEAVRTGEPVFVASLEELRARYPRADKRLLRMTAGALACIPLALEGRVIGAFKVRFDGPREFSDWEVTFFSTLAHAAAQAIERARLWEDTQRLNDTLRRVIAAERGTAAELGAVIHAMGEPVVVCDREGRVRLANQAARTVLGGRRLDTYAAIVGRFDDPGGDAPALGGTTPQGPVELRLKDTDRWLELTTYPVPATDDDAGGWSDLSQSQPIPEDSAASSILVIRDITALRQAQQLRDAFMGILSHELRTPITTIFGGTRVLARAGLSEETRREVSADISAEAERLHRLVEDLLVLARAERGGLQLGADPVLIQHLLPRIVESEGARWPAKGFSLNMPRAMPTVSADPTYVEQVVRNLIGNAAKYSPDGTTVDVVAEVLEDEVHVRILDEGPGIESAEIGRLFELYYRSPATAAQSAGAGIGLFVCRALVEAMGGRIWAQPRPAGGAEFGFALPILVDEEF
jgi:signal transduction histidine kinase